MIPKVIHYCWFSNDRKPQNVARCIESWRAHLPDYEIKCWDMDAVRGIQNPFLQQALEYKKWAFASDFVRLYALYHEGGIYLDSDVQVWGRIDDLLDNDFFTGLEMRDKEHTQIYLEAAIMGACKGNEFVEKCLELYESRVFVGSDGSLDLTPIPTLISSILEDLYGWKREDSTQRLGNGTVYSTQTIANTNCERTGDVLLYHLNNRSWIPLTRKEKIYKFLKRLGLKKVKQFLSRK